MHKIGTSEKNQGEDTTRFLENSRQNGTCVCDACYVLTCGVDAFIRDSGEQRVSADESDVLLIAPVSSRESEITLAMTRLLYTRSQTTRKQHSETLFLLLSS